VDHRWPLIARRRSLADFKTLEGVRAGLRRTTE
jgi:hypothetical protein